MVPKKTPKAKVNIFIEAEFMKPFITNTEYDIAKKGMANIFMKDIIKP